MADHIQEGAKELAELADGGRATEAAERLRSDYLHMDPKDFNKLVNAMQKHDKDNKGIDIVITDKDRDGIPEITFHDSESINPFRNDEKIIGTRKENSMGRTPVGKGMQEARNRKSLGTDVYANKVPEQKKKK